MTNNKLTEIAVTEADIQTVLDAFDYRTGIDSHAEYIVRCALAELQERRKADSENLVKERQRVIDGLCTIGETAWEIEEYMKKWDAEHAAPPMSVQPLSITLPDTSSKAFWSGTGKKEVFHPETYKRWTKEAIERFCMIAGIAVEVN